MNKQITFTLLFFLLFLGLNQGALAQKIDKTALETELKNFSSALKKSGSVLTGNERCLDTCDDQKFKSSYENSLDKEGTLHSSENKKDITLSVLTKERLKDLFKKLAADEDNSFNFPMDGCFARAHRMAQVMDEMGIVSGKAFLEGHLIAETKYGENAEWGYHVASVILVEENGKQIPYIIDPAIFNKPVTHQEWKNKMLKNQGSKLEKEYFTNRYAYDTRAINEDLENYRDDELEDATEKIKSFRRLGDMIELIDSKESQAGSNQ